MYDGTHGKKQISLVMIVKDEEDCLERAILSVKDLVFEIVVVDTGSKDSSKEIALRHGAKVFEFPWNDDFSSARNESLRHATCEWILVLDADEAISKRDHPKLGQLIHENNFDGAYFFQRNYFEDPSAENWCVNKTDYEEAAHFTGYSDVSVLRLFRNKPIIYFEGMVHESVENTMQGRRKRYTEIPIHHFRKDSSKNFSKEKQLKYLDLLRREYEENPYSVKTCFLLGRQLFDLEQYPEAIAFLEQAVQIGTHSELVLENLAGAYYQCGMYPETIETLEKVIQFNPRYSEAYATIALAYYEEGKADRAVNSLVQAISLRPTSIRYHFNLAAIFYKEKDLEAAETHLTEAIKLSPKFTRSFYLLFFVLTEQDKNEDALEAARILERTDPELYGKIKDKALEIESKRVSR